MNLEATVSGLYKLAPVCIRTANKCRQGKPIASGWLQEQVVASWFTA